MHILRISNSLGPSSAPLNSFTLARSRIFSNESTTYIVFRKSKFWGEELKKEYYKDLNISENQGGFVKFIYIQGSLLKFYKYVKKWLDKAKDRKTSSIVHIHHPKRGFWFTSLFKLFRIQTPIVYTVHNNYNNYKRKEKVFLIFCFLFSDIVTFVSQSSFNSFQYKYIKPSNDKSIVIPNGVDVDRIESYLSKATCDHSNGYNEDHVIKLISIGRFVDQKNHMFLIDVMSKLSSSFILEIYGDGDLRNEIFTMIQNKKLTSYVKLKGNVSRKEVVLAMYNSDIFISPSFWEGLPMALLEAMAVGLPSLVSNIPAHREIKQKAESLLLADLHVDTWVYYLNQLSSMSHVQKKHIVDNNKQVVRKHYSINKMQNHYRKIYERLLQ